MSKIYTIFIYNLRNGRSEVFKIYRDYHDALAILEKLQKQFPHKTMEVESQDIELDVHPIWSYKVQIDILEGKIIKSEHLGWPETSLKEAGHDSVVWAYGTDEASALKTAKEYREKLIEEWKKNF